MRGTLARGTGKKASDAVRFCDDMEASGVVLCCNFGWHLQRWPRLSSILSQQVIADVRGDELVEAGYAELGSSGNRKRTMRGKISRTLFTDTLWYKHACISSFTIY